MYQFAGQLLRKGVAPRSIEKSLTDQGLDAEAAAVVVMQATNRVGRKNMIYGLLWCIGGIVVTALSYYVLAWGAILFGGFQFVCGLIQSFGRSPALTKKGHHEDYRTARGNTRSRELR
jgi:hypothetical protein